MAAITLNAAQVGEWRLKFLVLKQRLVFASLAIAGILWCLVYAGYVGHTAASQVRYTGLDLSLVGFALIGKVDKVAAPIAQLIFSEWLASDPRVTLIAGGMLCGDAFGIVGGVYLIAWNIERAFRGSDQHAAIQGTFRSISKFYLAVASFAIVLGAWYFIRLIGFVSDTGTVTTVLVAGLLGGLGVFCVYAALSWFAYWGVISGRQLWDSSKRFR